MLLWTKVRGFGRLQKTKKTKSSVEFDIHERQTAVEVSGVRAGVRLCGQGWGQLGWTRRFVVACGMYAPGRVAVPMHLDT